MSSSSHEREILSRYKLGNESALFFLLLILNLLERSRSILPLGLKDYSSLVKIKMSVFLINILRSGLNILLAWLFGWVNHWLESASNQFLIFFSLSFLLDPLCILLPFRKDYECSLTWSFCGSLSLWSNYSNTWLPISKFLIHKSTLRVDLGFEYIWILL